MKAWHPYSGCRAVLATMHGKEAAIRAPFYDGIGLDIVTSDQIDTDRFGTFSGEFRRKKGIKETAVAKARLGMQLSGLPIGIASEGSFGPHPEIPVIAADMELMVLVDDERSMVLSEALISEDTNFSHIEITPEEEISIFLERVQFPSHGLIVKPNQSVHEQPFVIKGIADVRRLREAISYSADHSADGKAFVQSDMRAYFNPTRMRVLGTLAAQLVERVKHLCPKCQAPGFGCVEVERGLPCDFCGTPTRWVKTEIIGCESCTHREKRGRRDALQTIGRESCPVCNP